MPGNIPWALSGFSPSVFTGEPRSAHCVASTSLQLCSGGVSILKLLATLFLLTRPMKRFICQESNCWLGFSLAPAAPTPAKQPQPMPVASTAAKHPAPKPSPGGANGNGEPGPGDTAREHKPHVTQVQHPQRGVPCSRCPPVAPGPRSSHRGAGDTLHPGDAGFLPGQASLPGLLGYKYLAAWLIFSSGKGGGGFPTAISACSSSPRGAEQPHRAGQHPADKPWGRSGLCPALPARPGPCLAGEGSCPQPG